jgi:signal transduction histidine kinase
LDPRFRHRPTIEERRARHAEQHRLRAEHHRLRAEQHRLWSERHRARLEHYRSMLLPRRTLQRRLFVWFGITIVATVLAVAMVFGLLGPSSVTFRNRMEAVGRLISEQFQGVWAEPAERHALAERFSRALEIGVTVEAPDGRVLDHVGPECKHRSYAVIDVKDGGRLLGRVRGCVEGRKTPLPFLAALVAAAFTIWVASAWIAHRLTRPLGELVRVTREIGSGKLTARVRLGRHQAGEVGGLASAINDMAERLEKQLRDQRELLAAVSHEIRSPLARLRVLSELARNEASRERAVQDLEREIVEIDELVGKLLANSRLDFEAISTKPLSAAELARRALEGAGLPSELLDDRSDGALIDADPTLLGRALANLLDNACTHGNGVAKVLVERDPALPSAPDASGAAAPRERVRFEVIDRGPGVPKDELPRIFEPFYRSGQRGHGNLGLGLSLVDRIVRAHGGSAFAHNRPEGGASVGFRLPVAAP